MARAEGGGEQGGAGGCKGLWEGAVEGRGAGGVAGDGKRAIGFVTAREATGRETGTGTFAVIRGWRRRET